MFYKLTVTLYNIKHTAAPIRLILWAVDLRGIYIFDESQNVQEFTVLSLFSFSNRKEGEKREG